jgi:hypothetical protein
VGGGVGRRGGGEVGGDVGVGGVSGGGCGQWSWRGRVGAVACVFGEGGRVGVDGVAAKFAAEEVGDEGGGGDTSERAVSGAVVLGEGRGGGEEEWSRAGAEKAGYGKVGFR